MELTACIWNSQLAILYLIKCGKFNNYLRGRRSFTAWHPKKNRPPPPTQLLILKANPCSLLILNAIMAKSMFTVNGSLAPSFITKQYTDHVLLVRECIVDKWFLFCWVFFSMHKVSHFVICYSWSDKFHLTDYKLWDCPRPLILLPSAHFTATHLWTKPWSIGQSRTVQEAYLASCQIECSQAAIPQQSGELAMRQWGNSGGLITIFSQRRCYLFLLGVATQDCCCP